MNEKRLQQLLQSALPPVGEAPPRDLWPAMRRRLDGAAAPPIRLAAWEWALAAVLAAAILLLPVPLAGISCLL
jgi:hypothetical protein